MKYSKGAGPVSANYARGGPVISTRSRFMKTPDSFMTDKQPRDFDKTGKGGELSKLEGDTKKEKAIKPHT